MKLTKEEALKKIEELKKYVADEEEKETNGYIIRNRYDNSEIYVSRKDNVRDAVIEAVEKNVNLSETDLSGANLFGADLYGANLSGADLSESNLFGADLSGADLSGADLSEADLYGADLYGVNLSGADLSGANLYNARFYGKGGTIKLKKNQVEDFLNALGFQIEN